MTKVRRILEKLGHSIATAEERDILVPKGMRAQKSGSIVNISSIWGVAAVPSAAAYHATKVAVRHLTKHVAVAYAADNVRANSVHPGIVTTPMVLVDQAKETSAAVVRATPLGRMGQAIELARGVLFLASDASSFVTGAEGIIDGGLDAAGRSSSSERLRRAQVVEFFRGQEPCRVGTEASATAYHWARELIASGHEVKIMPPA
jgi:enoyl-ACP reductase-like protein